MELKGGHLPGGCELLERTGLVKITNKKVLPTGATEYIIEEVFNNRQFTKTVFPETWTQEKIIKAAWDTYENGNDYLTKNQANCRIYMFDNFEMTAVIKNFKKVQNNNKIINIKTLLPYNIEFYEKNIFKVTRA